MGKINLRSVGIGAAVFILLAIIVWQLLGISTSAEPLSEADVRKIAKERYSGEIIEVALENGIYHVELQLETGMYDLKIDRSSGDVVEITRMDPENKAVELPASKIKEIIEQEQEGKMKKLERRMDGEYVYYDAVIENNNSKTSLTIDAKTGEIVDITTEKLSPPEEVAKILTETQAINIALDTVKGEIDDVDFEESGGVIHYLVEVERDNGQDAIVQINAITGEVMSITWDD